MAPLKVLVVEDDAMIGMLLAEMLADMGYVVCAIASTEAGAVAEASRHSPGLMIVDEHLRPGSGRSAVGQILRTGPVPCVFISGAPIYPVRSGTVLLLKPFVELDLIRAIAKVAPAAMPVFNRRSAPDFFYDDNEITGVQLPIWL